MPAIQPVLLRRQAALLAEQFDQPTAYIRSLHHLLDFYADRSRRVGQGGTAVPLIDAYQVKPPVLRQIIFELYPSVEEHPYQSLVLCDQLWMEAVFEFRQLAVMLLGNITPELSDEIVTRLNQWIGQHPEKNLLDTILEHGCKRLRSENQDQFVDMVIGWLETTDPVFQQMGIRALLELVEDPGFDNFPVVFQYLQPYLISVPAILRPDVLDLIRALARRSPQEAAFFLRQQLSNPEQKEIAYMIRQSAPDFPVEIRERLLNLVRIR